MASLRQKFHLVDNGLMAHVQCIGSREEASGGGEVLMSVFIPRSPGVVPSVSHQRTNV